MPQGPLKMQPRLSPPSAFTRLVPLHATMCPSAPATCGCQAPSHAPQLECCCLPPALPCCSCTSWKTEDGMSYTFPAGGSGGNCLLMSAADTKGIQSFSQGAGTPWASGILA